MATTQKQFDNEMKALSIGCSQMKKSDKCLQMNFQD